MKKQIAIIGAGMAGLFAGKVFAGRGHDVELFEAQAALPNNHSAVLRFRTPNVGDMVGQPFKRVTAIKASEPWSNPLADTLAYSRKCTGTTRSDRSIITAGVSASERYIAPADFIARMAEGLNIHFGGKILTAATLDEATASISTIPMPALMDILKYPHKPEFLYVHGFNLKALVHNCEAYASLYVPSPSYKFNRVSITGDEVIAEYSFPGLSRLEVEAEMQRLGADSEAMAAIDLIGFNDRMAADAFAVPPAFTMQPYSKILPIDEAVRRDFIHWATDKFGIFSLGRFATWRPGLLLDDCVNDLRVIERIMGSKYETERHRTRAVK